ncbi:DNA-directed RNA polymerase subunit D [Halocatena pleomorpha]|uniref:DNA-directed RNA polymerase subunit Rpo3 n=1 Tax=Halocatena pleomorpha TaxID=1785090 RepID=A0A3P3R3Y4_9EURY|nr:DNA-directed RNA polymerase subunit D [Halocatena pleomorpha]RRJ28187.1 DNA-directed RNA polymerase subunit D [Halocatena pleomorpha]
MAGDFEVQFIDRGERTARFVVRGVTPAFANGLRRAIVADVPTLSIDSVRIIENSSVMFDEQIALRLGLVPLTTPPDEFEEGDSVTLALDVEGPDTAYSGDLVSNHELVEPADKNIPIIELKYPETADSPQRLELEADAVMGRGREHAKNQGGIAVGYRHLQTVDVVGDQDAFNDGSEESTVLRGVIEESAAEHAVSAGNGTPENGQLVPTETFDNDLAQRYPDKEVDVRDVPESFVFHVESDGSMSIDELVLTATDTLLDRADELEQAVSL